MSTSWVHRRLSSVCTSAHVCVRARDVTHRDPLDCPVLTSNDLQFDVALDPRTLLDGAAAAVTP